MARNLPLIFAEILAAGVLITHGSRAFAGTFTSPTDTAGGDGSVEALGQPAHGTTSGAGPMPGVTGGRAIWLAARELALAAPVYVYGGGHASNALAGADCSGAISYVLNRAGLLKGTMTSSEFMSYGDPGAGKHVTIYANPGHVLMQIDGHFFGTSGFGHPDAPNGTGANWFSVKPSSAYLAQFTARHPAGL